MTFTFDPALTTDLDQVRALAEDTDPNDYRVTDETIRWALAQRTSVKVAAADVRDMVGPRLLIGEGVSSQNAERNRNWRRQSEGLRLEGLTDAGATGISLQ